MSETEYERRDSAAWLTLNRPDRRNALTPTMIAELADGLRRAEADDRVRTIVLTGAPPAFSAGADLSYFRFLKRSRNGLDRFLAELLHPLADVLRRLRNSPRPVIAAVNGSCVAGGLEIALACDIVIAGRTATFCDAHAHRSLAPALGAVGSLVHAVGSYRAKRVLLAAETLDAATMRDFGLVTEIAEPDELVDRVQEFASMLAARSPRSLALLKSMVHRVENPSWEERLTADLADFAQGWGEIEV